MKTADGIELCNLCCEPVNIGPKHYCRINGWQCQKCHGGLDTNGTHSCPSGESTGCAFLESLYNLDNKIKERNICPRCAESYGQDEKHYCPLDDIPEQGDSSTRIADSLERIADALEQMNRREGLGKAPDFTWEYSPDRALADKF